MISLDDRGQIAKFPSRLNIAQHVLWANGADDEKIALSVASASGIQHISYGQLRQDVLRTGRALLDTGLVAGDRLLLRISNRPDFPITFLGAIAAGVLPVPTSASLTEREITIIADTARPNAIVASPGVALPLSRAPVLRAEKLRGHPSSLSRVADTYADDSAYVVFTSGTSGTPEGIVHAHRAIWARRVMIDGWYGMTPDDRMLHAGAMNWTYTLGTGLLDPWSQGATAVVLEEGTALSNLPCLAARYDATIIAGAPGVFRRILAGPLPTMRRLRHGLSAGERLAPELRAAWTAATGTDLIEAFGQTECSTFISGSPKRPAPNGTTGYAQPGRRIAIIGRDGPVPRGEVGEIAIDAQDPGVMSGYLDQPDRLAARLFNGWFMTGDAARMETDGAVTHLGRLDDILTAGGFRISPTEVEEAMLCHPDIIDAAAVEERLGPEKTIVVLHYASATPLSIEDLKSQAEKYLARYKQPRKFQHHASLPRGSSGKLLRARLRAATDAE